MPEVARAGEDHGAAVGGLVDGDEAVEVLARLQRLVNDTWERRGEIVPSTTERQRLNPLAVYKLLPRTNCRVCGEPLVPFLFGWKIRTAGQY